MESSDKSQLTDLNKFSLKYFNERKKNFDKNSNCTYEKEYQNLDSSIKKINSFVKKIKCFSDNNYDSILKELKILNLRRYSSEMVSAIFELKFKISHLPFLIRLVTKIHRRYPKFSEDYLAVGRDRLNSLFKNLAGKSSEPKINDEKILAGKSLLGKVSDPKSAEGKLSEGKLFETDARNMKILTSLFMESILAGLSPNPQGEFQLLINFWKNIFLFDKNNDFLYCALFAYFVKEYGFEFDLLSNSQIEYFNKNNIEYLKYIVTVKNVREEFKNFVFEYYSAIEDFCIKNFRKREKMIKSNELYVGLNGALTAEQKKNFKNLSEIMERVIPAVEIIAQCLDKKLELKSEEEIQEVAKKVQEIQLDFEEKVNVDNKWEDEDDQRFYEDLKDCSHFCHTATENELEKVKKSLQEQYRLNRSRSSQNQENYDEDFDEDFDLDQYQNKPKTKNANMEAFLTKLKGCINRDLIDSCVEDFLRFLNIKANRRIVIDNIFSVSRDRLDLLPFYARFLASTYPYCPEMALEIAILLRKEFYYHLRKQSQFNIQSKIKSCRFIGELVKFKIYSKLEGINFLKSLLINFHGHTVDMLCHLLESCGRFLNNSPESRPLLQSVLGTIEKKRAFVTEGEYKIQIQNAINSCDPQEIQQVTKNVKELPILHQFIKYLFFDFLNRTTIVQVIENFKLLPLDDEDCLRFVIKCITRPWKLKYANITSLASLIFQIRKISKNIDVVVVDEIIEEIRLGLETNFPRHNQRRICTIKFFGELYNYQIIEGDMILACSFNIITFGHRGTVRNVTLDPPTNHTRIHLICELFKTCGHYLLEDPQFKNFDGFFILFQAYFWHKKLGDYYIKHEHKFPAAVESNVKEMFELLRMKRRYFDSADKVLAEFSKQTYSVYGEIGHVIQRHLSRGAEIKLGKVHEEKVKKTPKSESEEEIPIDDEAEFEKEYERTLIESMNEKSTSSGQRTIDLVLPSNLKDKYFTSQNRLEDEIKDDDSNRLKICLLTKKNNKKVLKDVDIPKGAPLARTVIHKYHGRMDELKEVKRVILNMNKK